MMTTGQYRDRASHLLGLAEVCISDTEATEMRRLAAEWHELARLADLQDQMAVALQGTREPGT